jgi:hypothetical protein
LASIKQCSISHAPQLLLHILLHSLDAQAVVIPQVTLLAEQHGNASSMQAV